MKNARQINQGDTTTLFSESDVCLFELTDSGTILYCRNNAGLQLNKISTEIVGRNLFEESAPFENTEELQGLLHRFIKNDSQSQTFTFQCRIKNKVIPARIMLVRANNKLDKERGETTIVDIRKL